MRAFAIGMRSKAADMISLRFENPKAQQIGWLRSAVSRAVAQRLSAPLLISIEHIVAGLSGSRAAIIQKKYSISRAAALAQQEHLGLA